MSTSSVKVSYHEIEVKALPELPHYNSHESGGRLFRAKEYEGGGSFGRRWLERGKWRRWLSLGGSSRVENWKPMTLRTPVLGLFIVLSTSLIVILELLARAAGLQQSLSGSGAVAYADEDGNISTADSFLYLYFPTVVAVCYSMLWSWVDLDVKRLEPWFQLSKPNGAMASDSLLLHYPFEFLAFVPMRAFRRRHWNVFYAGIITMVIFWVITPLQSAIFSTGTVIRNRPTTMIQSGALLPMVTQTTALNTNFMNTAYAISWLNQSLPPYSTVNYALQPFDPVGEESIFAESATWSTTTLAYSTNLTCKPAATIGPGSTSNSYTFDDGEGCRVTGMGLPGAAMANSSDHYADYMVLYIPYWDNPEEDYSLQMFGNYCSIQNSHKFLALWGSIASQAELGVYGDLVALFCQTNYYATEVNAVVNGRDQSVASSDFDAAVSAGKSKSLSDDIFNATHFEYLIGTGISPILGRKDYQDTILLEQYPRLASSNLTWPNTNMVGFGIAANVANNYSVADMSDPLVLAEAFQNAHKILFSAAISTLLTPSTNQSSSTSRAGYLHDQPAAIIFVRPFAIAVEVAITSVVALVAVLWLATNRRPSKLTRDLATIGDIMSLARDSGGIAELFRDNGSVTADMLERRLHSTRFALTVAWCGGREQTSLRVTSAAVTEMDDEPDRIVEDGAQPDLTALKAVRPLEMKLCVGGALILAISAALTSLVVLYTRIQQINGFALPSSDTVFRSFLENALPIAFASLLEPFWVVLNRLLCVLRPFEDLRKGNAKSATTIHAKYTALPPQLSFWRALGSRHYVLAALCIVVISSNALAVTLSVVFDEASVPVELSIDLVPALSARLLGDVQITSGGNASAFTPPITYSDHFYVVMANISDGTALPPWVDNNYFYLPRNLPLTPPNYVKTSNGDPVIQHYTTSTRGFGVAAQCRLLLPNASDNGIVFQIRQNDSAIKLFTRHVVGSTDITCAGGFNPGPLTNASSAVEFIGGLSPLNESDSFIAPVVNDHGFCSRLLLMGWARIGPAVAKGSLNDGTKGRSFDYKFISCQPSLVTLESSVRFDSNGRVLSAMHNTTPSEAAPFSSTDETRSLGSQINSLVTAHNDNGLFINHVFSGVWHTDAFTSDWINSILKAYLNSSSALVDPTVPLPADFSTRIVPALEDVIQRLSAVLLSVNSPYLFLPFNSSSDAVNATASPASISPGDTSAILTIIETRIFMDPIMFKISITLLACHLLMAIMYYAWRPKAFLPRMPTTIASLLAFVSMSRAVADVGPEGKVWRTGRRKSSAQSGRYSYGRFVGVDGGVYVGIERAGRVA